MLNPPLCDVCFVLDASLAILSEIKQYRHEAQKSHDKWWNYDNYSAASVILGIFVANSSISSRGRIRIIEVAGLLIFEYV